MIYSLGAVTWRLFGFLIWEAVEVGRIFRPFQVLFLNFFCPTGNPLGSIVGVKVGEELFRCWQARFQDLQPEPEFLRLAAFAFPLVNGFDGGV